MILVSRPVRQALALDTLESLRRPFPIANAKAGTIVVAELKFRQVTLQVLFTAERVGAAHTAFEHAEEVIDVVGREAKLVHILVCGVVHLLVVRIGPTGLHGEAAFVGNESCSANHIGEKDIADLLCGDALLNVEGAHGAVCRRTRQLDPDLEYEADLDLEIGPDLSSAQERES